MKMEAMLNKIKKTETKKLAIYLLLGLALILVFYLILNKNSQPEDKSQSSACLDLKTRVLAEIDKMNNCSDVNDCVLINGCPYGCNNLVNKNAEWGALNELSFEFVDKCGECTDICQGALRAGEIGCEAGKCVSLRK